MIILKIMTSKPMKFKLKFKLNELQTEITKLKLQTEITKLKLQTEIRKGNYILKFLFEIIK